MHQPDVGLGQNSHYFANFLFFWNSKKSLNVLTLVPRRLTENVSTALSLSHSLSLSHTHTHTYIHVHTRTLFSLSRPWRVFAAVVVVFYPDVIAITHTQQVFSSELIALLGPENISPKTSWIKYYNSRKESNGAWFFFSRKKVALKPSCWSCQSCK